MFRRLGLFFLFCLLATTAWADIDACRATIEGSVFQDVNQNGDRDPEDEGMGAIVRIYTDFWGGPIAEMETGRLTAAPGRYIFPIVQTGKTYFVCVSLDSCSIQTHPSAVGGHAVFNIGPHGPNSGTPDEGDYCWEVSDPFHNRRFGVHTFPCE
jgi:hypothetical protein